MSKKSSVTEETKPSKPNLELTNEERKDIKLVALEITNLQLQMQALQGRFNELQQSARAFQAALLKAKELSTDDYIIDFNALEIVRKN